MYLIETDINRNVIGAHNTPVALESWQPNGAAIYEVAQGIFDAANGHLSDYLYNGATLTEKLTASADPNPAAVDVIVTVTATLPEGATDTEVTFQVEEEAAVVEAAANLQASHAYAFALAGTYRITVSSATHGNRVVGVVVE